MKRIRLQTHREVVRPLMKDTKFRKGYEEELERLRLVQSIIELREKRGMTQREVARRIGATQPFIAKLERAESHNFTIRTLHRLVDALGGDLVVQIRPRGRVTHARS